MTHLIPPQTIDKQRRASDPSASVWVSANAGSGKTYVLTQRVARLLLHGVPPAKILCLTFTKAAAANMATRVFEELARWTRLDDAALKSAVLATGATRASAQDLREARRLFARTVETPGGLKIQTIHAFCERLLHLFPFEANAPGRFEVADELAQAELLQRARSEVLGTAARDDAPLRGALGAVAAECSADAFEKLLEEAVSHRALSPTRWPHDLGDKLRQALGLAKRRDSAAIRDEIIENGIAPSRWSEIVAFLDTGSGLDHANAKAFRSADNARATDDSDGCLAAYLSVFYNKDHQPSKKLITKKLAIERPQLKSDLDVEQARVVSLFEDYKRAATVERTVALAHLVEAIFKRYDAMKTMRGVLDYNDLIAKALTLLKRSDAAWVLYKLDSGIDHILVDEAQDTSAAQWDIFSLLTDDFASGSGRHMAPRTFFAVGDEKQSIFSFQGAAPQMFGEMRRSFETRFKAGDQTFAHVRLTHSFRSARGVLAAVDTVFANPDNQRGLIEAKDAWMAHEALKDQLPALVEIWPALGAKPHDAGRDWRLPLDILDEMDPASVIAKRVAQKIAALVSPHSEERVFDAAGRAQRIRPGDILILVRTRGPFFDAVIRALKQTGVPVSGADRLQLAEHIAVLDLVAAGQAALLPQDDLNLAAALKSPLLGLDDDDLLQIAPYRRSSLIDALESAQEPRFSAARQTLANWRSRLAQTPFAFYAALLSEDGGRRALEARLGPEAADAIDEFLRLALAYEAEAAPSLAGFLADFAAVQRTVKRDMDSGADAVRVMTVHAAKGLEAKIVFLPDTCGVPTAHHDPKIFWLSAVGSGVIAWSPSSSMDCDLVAKAREAARAASYEEYRRLFYVAMTRAEERLYIAGFHGLKKRHADCWSHMIESTLAQADGIERAPAFWNEAEEVLRLVSGTAALAETAPQPAAAEAAAAPGWLWRAAAPAFEAAAPLRPSSALSSADLWGNGISTAAGQTVRAGELMHVLLQYLPELPSEGRARAGQAFLDARAADLEPVVRQSLVDGALAVIGAPELAALFGPSSKAEVAVSGSVALADGEIVEIAGRIDRIGVAEAEVLVVDFKTGAAAAVVPPAYATQMALYRAALAPLWPGKKLRMRLIWTEGPTVVDLDDATLDAALAAVAARTRTGQAGPAA